MPIIEKLPDLTDKTEDELLQMKLELEIDLDSIKAQIRVAKAKAASLGEFADPEWWRKVNWAKSLKGRLCQQIQLELHRRKDPKTALGLAFLEVAKKCLEPDLFEQ